ncbi:WD40/YVTN/BNR-like repeat-containing protein [Aquabacterium sp. OR-4]|uniref:WD40/YVTN/BNR-like repeat-containing protein n=1 Tax=Aquabacterium sp. OR-4 TaxID=2978127 RepID=UPI0028C98245|nr:YCF48-related protein [Aquabacterium sp. OR-4]MDT7838984.1 YCF48-related protein [Aquabacterium sp. OR-4]
MAGHMQGGGLRRRQVLGAAGLGASGLALLAAAGVRAAAPLQAPAAARLPVSERPALALRRPTQCVLLAAARAGKRLLAAGERGVVVGSDDGGRSWQQAEVPTSVTLTALAFADERLGWAVGHQGVVLRTDDGGRRWQRLAAEGGDRPLLHLALRRDGTLIASGAYGLVQTSRDGGRQWAMLGDELPNPEGLSLYGHVERDGEQWLFGEQGLLLRADAANPRFRAHAAPQAATLFSGLALRDGTLLIGGLRGRLLRSAAPGAAFESVATPVDASLLGAAQLADGTVLLAGAAGQLLASRDAGQRFVPVPLNTRFPFAAVAAAPDGALLLAGQRGLLRVEPSALEPRSLQK